MKLDFIEYLKDKNFEVEEIIKLQKLLRNNNFDDQACIKKFDAVYKIFGYATLPELIINNLIINNIAILKKSDYELISIAYTWLKTGLIQDAAVRNTINCQNYVRTFLRDLYLNSGINLNKSPISYNALIMGDKEFSNDYIGKIDDKLFYPSLDNLTILYGKGEDKEKKYEYIKTFIIKSALSWYMECLNKDKKLNNDRSI